MKIDQKQLGEAVRSVRKLRHLTQAELAKAVGLAPNTVAILERGERPCSLRTLNALAKALNVPAACLAVMGSPNPSSKSSVASQMLLKLQSLITTIIEVEQRTIQRPEPKRPSRPRHAAKA